MHQRTVPGLYADQASNYHCAQGVTQDKWNCDVWNKFGTDFAYAQMGMFAWMHNGTTIAMSKKGSGVSVLVKNKKLPLNLVKDAFNRSTT